MHLKRFHGVFALHSRLRCGGKLKIIASIEQPAVIAKILAHLERKATTARGVSGRAGFTS